MGELKDALKSHKLRTFMNSLGISTEDVWTLFMCLDFMLLERARHT